MLQADTKVKHVHVNLLCCCLLRREKAHKGLNLLFLIIKCVAGLKAKHIKKIHLLLQWADFHLCQ